VKGYTSGINFDAMKWERPRESALKVMPSTTGIAKSGSETEPRAKKNKKFFSQPYLFRLPVIYPVRGCPFKINHPFKNTS
jgi:hypothetical protein